MAVRTQYGMKKVLRVPPERAAVVAREALAAEGFGVLTEIDVRATLRAKLDLEFRPYVILGACNPALAHAALSRELDIGLLLPCNVIVYEGDKPGTSVVAAIDPVTQLGITGRNDVEALAQEVRTKLERVIDSLAS